MRKWGVVPFWAKDPKAISTPFNARSEEAFGNWPDAEFQAMTRRVRSDAKSTSMLGVGVQPP